MARINSHRLATIGVDWFRAKVDAFYQNGDALYREISERDYGVDGIIELFENGTPTGKIAFVQIKTTSMSIVPLKRPSGFVSCAISTSNAMYAIQTNIPVLLVFISLTDEHEMFYFADLGKAITEEQKQKVNEQDTISIRIPIENVVVDDLEPMFEIIRSYY